MKKGLIKLPRNRVRRNYLGGMGIDVLHDEMICVDNNMPEEWIGSMTEAYNPGMEPIAHEGLCCICTENGTRFLRDIIDEEKQFYLGKSIHKDGTWQLSFLLKILDSAMRLHVQAHPSTSFANKVMGNPYGKLECYFILDARKGVEPYIRLGFQHAPSKNEWRDIIRSQDQKRMDSCFEKIPVKPGEVWYIPGGMPHAIGEGITMLEIMEPSDLVVRCEFEREGIVVPEDARFMGRDLDFCLDIFDYHQYSSQEIQEKCRVQPKIIESGESFEHLRLIDETLTPCFFVDKLVVRKNTQLQHNHRFTLGVLCSGSCTLESSDGNLSLKKGDSFLIAAAVDNYKIHVEHCTEIAIVYPGKDMES